MSYIQTRPSKPISHRQHNLGLWALPINRLQDFYEYAKQERQNDGTDYAEVLTVGCCDTDRCSDVFGTY